MSVIFILITIISLIGLLIGSQCCLTIYLFYKGQHKYRNKINDEVNNFYSDFDEADFPFVTIQLPVYNESLIIKRLILSAAEIDYPYDKFEIQVIDDSTDETIEIIDNYISELKAQNKISIYTVRRDNRKGFKAGALANALQYAKGDYTAIFDADFIIPKHFLKRTIPQIYNKPDIACIQGRWGHENRYNNWITRAASIGLDAHITTSMASKSYSSLCPIFCGTAGIIKISSINDAGGWSGKTITEDQDLSYRMWSLGFKIIYDYDLVNNAEIPNNLSAFKSQQKRWAKGGIETLLKLFPTIVKSEHLNFIQKVDILYRMLSSFTSLLLLIYFILLLPILMSGYTVQHNIIISILWIALSFASILPWIFYIGSCYFQQLGYFAFKNILFVNILYAGSAITNSISIIEALLGKKSAFIRTPKSGSTNLKTKDCKYKIRENTYIGYIEILSGIYCFFVFVLMFIIYRQYFWGFLMIPYVIGINLYNIDFLSKKLKSFIYFARKFLPHAFSGKY